MLRGCGRQAGRQAGGAEASLESEGVQHMLPQTIEEVVVRESSSNGEILVHKPH